MYRIGKVLYRQTTRMFKPLYILKKDVMVRKSSFHWHLFYLWKSKLPKNVKKHVTSQLKFPSLSTPTHQNYKGLKQLVINTVCGSYKITLTFPYMNSNKLVATSQVWMRIKRFVINTTLDMFIEHNRNKNEIFTKHIISLFKHL